MFSLAPLLRTHDAASQAPRAVFFYTLSHWPSRHQVEKGQRIMEELFYRMTGIKGIVRVSEGQSDKEWKKDIFEKIWCFNWFPRFSLCIGLLACFHCSH